MRRTGFSFFYANCLQLAQKRIRSELPPVNEASIENYFRSCPPTLPASWRDMTKEEKLQCAIVESEFNSAEMAYYHGLACQKFGQEFDGRAICAFEKAKELDPNLGDVCDEKIAEIYKTPQGKFR